MKNIILVFILLFLIYSCANTDKDNNSTQSAKKSFEKKEIPFDSIFVTDTLHLEENLNKRFRQIYEGKTVFNDGSTFDIKTPLVIGAPKDISQTFLISNNFEHAITRHPFDSMGVVMIGKTYHPTIIGRIALKAIEHYKKTKSTKAEKVFFDQLRWMENNFHENEYYGFWVFPFSFPAKHLESGWPSVFSQGLLLNVCLEAYKLTGDKKYAKMLEKALKAFLVPVEYGGFMREWNKGELWLEEYPTKNPSRVLNGIIYGLEGVYNVGEDLDLELAKKIFHSASKTLKNHLEEYNAFYSSRYSLSDINNQIAKENYHEGHIIQLLWMYLVTGNNIFKKYAQTFLESDRYDFFAPKTQYYLESKIKMVTANHTIDTVNHGVEHLSDELWAYGKFWSSYKKTDLIIDFGEKKNNIYAVTLYHVSQQSKNVDFTIYAFDEKKNSWKYIEQFKPKFHKSKISVYNETGGYETYIEHFPIVEPLNAQKIKIVFEATNENIIALREINFIFDRSDDIKHLLEVVDERMEDNH